MFARHFEKKHITVKTVLMQLFLSTPKDILVHIDIREASLFKELMYTFIKASPRFEKTGTCGKIMW